MTIKEIIEKAIEGGWNKKIKENPQNFCIIDDGIIKKPLDWEKTLEEIVLDPKFWEAVGKVYEFDAHDKCCNIFNDYCTHNGECDCEKCDCNLRYAWKHKMHDMIYHLCSGGTIETFIKTL